MPNNITEEIKPCSDHELHGLLSRIVEDPSFPAIISFIYPDRSLEEMERQLLSYTSVRDYQLGIMIDAIKRIIALTMSEFSYGGTEYLKKGRGHLFVANHRDIILDAFLLQYVLALNGHETTQITIGSNLIDRPLMAAIARVNKMFTIERGGGKREFYDNLAQVSSYIRQVVVERNESVWIAQHNGRTKNGVDTTDPALVKMLAMSGGDDPVRALKELQIVPLCISYEMEPCDAMKARELISKARDGEYHKGEDEDFKSVLTGVLQPKGKVHLEICKPLEPCELEAAAGRKSTDRQEACNSGIDRQDDCAPSRCDNDFFKNVASIIDRRIREAYRPMATNYMACDLLSGTRNHAQHYSTTQLDDFVEYIDKASTIDDATDAMRRQLLQIYAAPVEQ